MTDYTEELSFAKKLAYQAGEIMLKYIHVSTKTVKDNNTPVTEADIEISNLLISEVKKHFPTHAVLDEEIKNEVPNNEYIWVCDPLDGTIPFSNGVPTSMFSLALCRNQEPVVAVCYDPFMKRSFHAALNQDSYCNDQKIEVNKEHLIKGAHVLAIPYWFNTFLKPKEFNTNRFYHIMHEKHLIVSLVESCVYSGMLVASGKVVAAIMPSAYAWDRAAVKLIVEHADGLYLDEKRNEVRVFGNHGLAIASNRVVSEELLDIVDTCIGGM